MLRSAREKDLVAKWREDCIGAEAGSPGTRLLEKCKRRWWPEVVAVGMRRGRQIHRGRLWYLMQLAGQGKRIILWAGARLVPSSSSFRKLANLMGDRLLVYSGGFLSSSRTACVLRSSCAAYLLFTPRTLFSVL